MTIHRAYTPGWRGAESSKPRPPPNRVATEWSSDAFTGARNDGGALPCAGARRRPAGRTRCSMRPTCRVPRCARCASPPTASSSATCAAATMRRPSSTCGRWTCRARRTACWSIRARWPRPRKSFRPRRKRGASASASRRCAASSTTSGRPTRAACWFRFRATFTTTTCRSAAGDAVRRLTETAAFETDPKFSPRGRYVSFIRDQDLYADRGRAPARSAGSPRMAAGSCSHGVAEFIAQEEMGRDTGYWWSPDEKHLAYTRSRRVAGRRSRALRDRRRRRARASKQRYPATGRPNAEVRLAILALDTGASARLRPRRQGRIPRARRVVPGGRSPAGPVADARPEAARRPLLPGHRRRVARSSFRSAATPGSS